jgi:hypothetical protein
MTDASSILSAPAIYVGLHFLGKVFTRVEKTTTIMSWKPRRNRKQSKDTSDYSVASDDDVKTGIARPSAMESSDDDDSYYNHNSHYGARGRRSHLIDSFKADEPADIVAVEPPPATTVSSNTITLDEKAIYRQASEMIDQHPSSRTVRSTLSSNPINTAITADEKAIYRQASDMIDQFSSSRNLAVDAPGTDAGIEEDNNSVVQLGSAAIVPLTSLKANTTSTPLVPSSDPIGVFRVPGPGSSHALMRATEDDDTAKVASAPILRAASHVIGDDDYDYGNEKDVIANAPTLAPATPASPPRRRLGQRASRPGAQYVRGIAPGVRITNYLEYMRGENNRMLVQHHPVPESASTPVEPIEPMPETYRTEPEENKTFQRKWYLLAAVIACVVIGVAVGVGVAVTSKSGGGGGSKSGSTGSQNPSPTSVPTTSFSPYTSDCKALKSQAQPNVLSQCICTGKISTIAKDVAARYDLLSQSFAPTVIPDFHETITSCNPVNQALVWLASGDGGGSSSNSEASMQQRYSVALLFIQLNGVHWTDNSGWLTSSSECDWYGIVCNGDQQVDSLALSDLNITGELPAETALLTSLRSLNLNNNLVNGTLPSELGQLTDLYSLQMSSNRIHGTIPTQLGTILNLTTIDLSNNTLTGQLPTEIGMWTATEYIHLQYNDMKSSIPSEIGQMPHLLTLNLRETGLYGTIPTELFNAGQILQLLDFSDNTLTGTIPTQVGQLAVAGTW